MSRKKKQIVSDIDTGKIFDSKDELYMYWYFKELKQRGYISQFQFEPLSFNLGENTFTTRRVEYKQLKTKVSQKESFPMLLKEHNYTPDFGIIWDEKANNIFYCKHNEIISLGIMFIVYGESARSLVEVKPNLKGSKYQGTAPKTTISRKWLLDKKDLYCQQINYEEIFYRTFTPKRFMFTDKSKTRKRVIKETPRAFEDYIAIRSEVNEEYYNLKQEYLKQESDGR